MPNDTTTTDHTTEADLLQALEQRDELEAMLNTERARADELEQQVDDLTASHGVLQDDRNACLEAEAESEAKRLELERELEQCKRGNEQLRALARSLDDQLERERQAWRDAFANAATRHGSPITINHHHHEAPDGETTTTTKTEH